MLFPEVCSLPRGMGKNLEDGAQQICRNVSVTRPLLLMPLHGTLHNPSHL